MPPGERNGADVLATYQEARSWAVAIREAEIMRRMPQRYAEGPMGHFLNGPRLTGEDVSTIRKWAEDKAPEGSPTDLPPSLSFANSHRMWRFQRPAATSPVDHPPADL